jgi:hypothetical protein
MPIPTEADHREANCDMLARGILGQLRTLPHFGTASCLINLTVLMPS